MKKPQLLALVAALVAAPSWAVEHARWGYTGQQGPQHWARLDPAYVTCGRGHEQSPVDIRAAVNGHLAPIRFQYGAGGHDVLNDGHTIRVDYTIGSDIRLDGHRYDLKQFHFHSPSENRIDGQAYPLEAQFVHTDDRGHMVVVAVMFEQGRENQALDEIWDVLPMRGGERHVMHRTVLAADLLPRDRSYFRYQGSLTVPPCTEGVTWLVLKRPLQVSAAQLQRFRQAMHGANNRPLQALSGRVVRQ